MRKLVISALTLAAMTSFAMAGEPVKLTASQLDQVAAGNPCSFAFASKAICIQENFTKQVAIAEADFFSTAVAANSNSTLQVMGDDNSF